MLKNIFTRALACIVLGAFVSIIGFQVLMPNTKKLPMPQHTNSSNVSGASASKSGVDWDYKLALNESDLKSIGPIGKISVSPKLFFFPIELWPLTINLIIFALCELVFLYFRKQEIETENAQLRQINLEAKNNQLKMQLHPHFLFNSLNTLRLLLKKDAEKAEDYLLKLSEILRFSTESALQNLVDIEAELSLCLKYLQMQKVRFGDKLIFFVTNDKLYQAKGKLPVFSLQLLAENAIKHNAFTDENPLAVFIDYDEIKKTITVRNKIQPKRTGLETTTNTGLYNLQSRYFLLSEKDIIVNNHDAEFSVTLSIL